MLDIILQESYNLALTLKWSRRGSLWTLKSVFAYQRENAEYPDAAVSWLLHAYHPASPGMCLKKIALRVARQLQMLLFPNALCCSLYERNCVCAVTKIFTKFLPANNFCQLLRVTRKRSCTSAGNAQSAQLHFLDDQQRAFGISNISNCVRVPMDPCWLPTGGHSTKIIFHIHVTFDLWWLNINVDLRYYHISILIKID